MTATKTPPTNADAKHVERALLARLGLPASASAQDVEATHDGLADFLETAPDDLAGWARTQIAAIDEAYALLSDPTIDRGAITDDAAIVAVAAASAPARPAASPVSAPTPAASRNPLIRRIAIGAALVVGAVAIAVAGFNLNGGTGVPPINGSPAPEAVASAGIDTAQVATLMTKIQADPKDVASLQSLADLYYEAGDYATSGGFLEKIIAIDPRNVTATLALGAVQFNQGDPASAEKQWRAVVALDENNVDAHYYLGFMYLSQDPADMANAKIEWSKVIAIDPDSSLAKSVSQHLASLDASPAPGTSAAPASAAPASAAPAASPVTSPAASPAPSASSGN